MDVSENRGTPKSILIGFSLKNHWFWDTPYFWKHPNPSIYHQQNPPPNSWPTPLQELVWGETVDTKDLHLGHLGDTNFLADIPLLVGGWTNPFQ